MAWYQCDTTQSNAMCSSNTLVERDGRRDKNCYTRRPRNCSRQIACKACALTPHHEPRPRCHSLQTGCSHRFGQPMIEKSHFGVLKVCDMPVDAPPLSVGRHA